MAEKITFTTTTVSELVTKLQNNDLPGALAQVFSSSAMGKLTAIQNIIKTLESQRDILNDQINRLNEELTQMIATAEISN